MKVGDFMNGFWTDSLFYNTHCGWVVERPEVYFNKDLFCEGEVLKVSWREPHFSRARQDSFLLRISHLEDDGNVDTVLQDRLVPGPWWPGLVQMIGTGAEEPLKEGAYIAEVLHFPPESEVSERLVYGDTHRFQVLNRDEYWEQWRDLFGEEWDDPIFWDEINGISRDVRPEESSQEADITSSEGRQLGQDLMKGLPIQSILNVLPEDVVWDAETILQLLGPVTSAFMLDERGRLPFNTTFSLNQSSSRVPHIDLTKVIWLLSVIGPACRDTLFESYRSHISVEMDREALTLIIRGAFPYPDRPYESLGLLLKNREAIFQTPEIFRVVEEFAGKHFNFKLDYHPHEVMINFY